MVKLSMYFMELCVNDKDPCWSTWLKSIFIEVWVLICFLSDVELAFVWLKGSCVINWNGNTMLWLGEGCSSYEHDKSLCVWCIKERVNNDFPCLRALSDKMIWCIYKCY